MNLAEPLDQWVRSQPDEPAIIAPLRDNLQSVSFRELHEAACRVVAMLRHVGFEPGDRVVLLQPMSIALYTAMVALFRAGLTVVVVDPGAGRAHVQRCLAIAEPRGMIGATRAHFLRLSIPALRGGRANFSIGWPAPFTSRFERWKRFNPDEELFNAPDDTPALLTFTSGSTGQPKAAVRTHGFLLAQHDAIARSLEHRAGERDLATLPIFVLANVASGVTSIIPDADLRRPGFVDPAPVMKQIATLAPDTTVASPSFLERLAAHARAKGTSAESFTRIFTGGAPVFPDTLDALQSFAPQARVIALYGSTEAEPIAHLERNEIDAADLDAIREGRGLLAGRPVSEIDLRIIPDQWGKPLGPFSSDAFDAMCRGTNEPGEIVVAGHHVLPGYLNGVGDEETKFRVDHCIWHRTGDAGRLDQRGRLWLLGRCSARVRVDGTTMYPFGAECAARQLQGVRRAAFLEHRGRRTFVIEASQTPDLHALREKLAWTGLENVYVVDELPLDGRHNAKIDYPELHRRLDVLQRMERALPG